MIQLFKIKVLKQGEAAEDPVLAEKIQIPTKTSDAQYDYVYANWTEDFTNVQNPLTITPTFSSFLRSYPVYFYNGSEKLQETRIYYGNYARYDGNEDEIKKIVGGVPSDYYEFASWSPSLDEPITQTTYFYAQYVFNGYIEDTWETIIQNVAQGNLDNYGYGGRKRQQITYSYQGVSHTDDLELEIIGKNHDTLSNIDPSYNNGATTAGLTFKGILKATGFMNTAPKSNSTTSALNVGGWENCEMREWLNTTLLEAFPNILQQNIKNINRLSDPGYAAEDKSIVTTADKIAIPSYEELGYNNSAFTTLGQGEPYPLYTDNNSRSIGTTYWTRSTYKMVHMWCIVDTQGYAYYSGGGNQMTIVFTFSI